MKLNWEQKTSRKELLKIQWAGKHPVVAVIHSVEDTPKSLTLQFIAWQDEKELKFNERILTDVEYDGKPKTKYKVLNSAISKLINIKNRRRRDGASYQSLLRVQDEIDKLMKLREIYK
jgi:hypothetical protein